MKHIIGGMDATKEFIFFKAFMCYIDALLKLLESYYGILKVVQMNQGVILQAHLQYFGKRVHLMHSANT
jgi:hypothetical protein